MLPGLTNANDLGSGSLKWKDLYLAGKMSGKDIKLAGQLEGVSAKFTGLVGAENFAWNLEKDYIMSINASGCVGSNLTNSVNYCKSDHALILPFKAYWPISIADGAKIKSFSAKIYDNQNGDMVCKLMKNSVDSSYTPTAQVIDSVQSSGTAGWATYKKTDIDEVVDNNQYSYMIYCQPVLTTTDGHLISGFKIEYSKSSPD